MSRILYEIQHYYGVGTGKMHLKVMEYATITKSINKYKFKIKEKNVKKNYIM